MELISTDIPCPGGYSVKADIYQAPADGPVMLSLIGRTSNRSKQRDYNFLPRLADELGITTVIFDYTGHGESPFDIEELPMALHLIETITAYDWTRYRYPDKKLFVHGSSYGGFLGAHLVQQRAVDGLMLRVPAIYRPEDFYRLKKDEVSDSTQAFRRDREALKNTPLLRGLAPFNGSKLVIVNELDEQVPRETTDAYIAALGAEVMEIEGASHSMRNFNARQIEDYNIRVFEWIRTHIIPLG